MHTGEKKTQGYLAFLSRTQILHCCITYDQADRRVALVYPSSLTANYGWDSLSDETQLAYTWKGSFAPGNPGTCTPGTTTNGATGNLTYGYDQDGRQVARGGTYFTLLPPSPFAASTRAQMPVRRSNRPSRGAPRKGGLASALAS